ncbi:MAG: 8-oxo-dGTP diphosphatase [Bacilli bacterium]|jgi:8-oxo-dGTP pyrophosphatase MutT (NUDIX family)
MKTAKPKIADVTNMIFIDDGKILLGYKKRGFGKGKYNGFGGKPLENETLLAAAIREAREESGLAVIDCYKAGIIDFGDSYLLRMHVYVAVKWSGSVLETEEMRPSWFPLGDIPYEKMWKDDRYWLPLVLQGKKIKATFNFMNNDDTQGTDDNEIVDFVISEVN